MSGPENEYEDDSGGEKRDPIPSFDPRAAINEYLARDNKPDFYELATNHSHRMREYVASPQFQTDAMESIRDAIQRMRRDTGKLDANLQPKALRAVQANEDWVKADVRKMQALVDPEHYSEREEAEYTQEQIDRDLENFELTQGIAASTATAARLLGQMEDARTASEKDHKNQARFNILLATGAIVVGIAMPFVEHIFLKDAPPKPEVVVLNESDLTVPPLLRRAIG